MSDFLGLEWVRAGALWGVRTLASLSVGALSFTALAALAAADGGYFPTAWGWAALAASCLVLLLAFRSELVLGSFDVLLLGGLAAFAVWLGTSIIWTRTGPQSTLEVERALVYLAGVAAGLLVLRRRGVASFLAGVLGAISTTAGYALLTRLFPGRFDTFDAIAGYRLTGSIGYWNALGIFVAIGVMLALGFAARASRPAGRAVAAATLVVLVPTLYFTYSRGAWVALFVAFFFALALDRRRLQLLATTLVLAPAPAIAVAVAATSRGLTHTNTSLEVAVSQGQRLALLLAPLCVLAAVSALALSKIEQRVAVSNGLRVAFGAGAAAAALIAALAVVVSLGGPASVAERVSRGLEGAPTTDSDLNTRLFSLSSPGRKAAYRVGWDAFRERPLIGSGAGSYEQHWLRERPFVGKVRDAHSLYLEALAELGVVGLLLLLTALAAPIAAAVAARREPLVPFAFGAYVAYLFHAGIDWDWEMPAVTLAGLACAVTLVVSARPERPFVVGWGGRIALGAAALAIGVFSFVGLVGNTESAEAGDAIRARNFQAAEASARKAIRWAPWSAEGWRRLGQSQLGREQTELAQQNLRKAIEKDPLDWERWFDLALATHGSEQRRALNRALELNPRSPEVAEFIRGVGLTGFDLEGG